ETNKLTQGPSTDDLTSTSCNNTPGLGELNNSSTEQIKNYTNTQMSSRDKDQHYNSKYPCNIKIDSLTHDLPEYNLSFGKKYFNFLDRAVKDESIYINEKLDQCYFSALQNYQQANFNMVETQDQLDVIFLRNEYDFNNWASYVYQLCGVLTNQEKIEMEHRLDYVIALEKISKRKKPIHYKEIFSLFEKYFSSQIPTPIVKTNDPDRDEQNDSDSPDTDTEVKIEISNPTPTVTPNTSYHDISHPINKNTFMKLASNVETSSTKVVTSKKQQPTTAVPDSKYINKSSAEEANHETKLHWEKRHVKFLKKVAAGTILKEHPKLIACFQTACKEFKPTGNTDLRDMHNYLAKICMVLPYDMQATAKYMLRDNGSLDKKYKENGERNINYMMAVEARINKRKAIEPEDSTSTKSSHHHISSPSIVPKLSPVIQRNKLPDFSPALNELNKSPKGYYPPPQNYFSPTNNNNFNNNFNNLNNTPITDRTSYTPPYGDKKYRDLINENASPLKQPNFNFSPRKQEVPTNEGLSDDQALSPKRELISDSENEPSVQPIPELQ
ncbi:unnamed protein product, partial [Rotaria magnacalcarata]